MLVQGSFMQDVSTVRGPCKLQKVRVICINGIVRVWFFYEDNRPGGTDREKPFGGELFEREMFWGETIDVKELPQWKSVWLYIKH